ncbi:MAG: hypothetical protein JXM68_10795 [Sedimentisphaerales bacterium]|nr:hypothetical protein [Sedimentisphaerales bacterium]
MIASQTVYDTCLALAKKDQRGLSFNINEYNKVAALVNTELYNFYVNKYESGLSVADALIHLKLRSQTLTLTDGQAWLHPDADRLAGSPWTAHPWGVVTATEEVTVINDPDTKVRVTSPNHGLKDGDVVTVTGLSTHVITDEAIHYIDKNSFWVDVDYSAADVLTSAAWTVDGASYKGIDIVTEQELSSRWADHLTKPSIENPVAVLDTGDIEWWVDGDVILGVTGSGNTFSIYNGYVAIAIAKSPSAQPSPPVYPLGVKTGDIITIWGGTNGSGDARSCFNGHHRVVALDFTDISPTTSYDSFYLPDLPSGGCAPLTEPTFAYFKLYDRKRINVYPTTIPTIYVNYIIRPVTPYLDYYVNDTTYEIVYLDKRQELPNFAVGYTYRDGTAGDGATDLESITENWEWDQDLLPQIVYMILQKMGINLENMGVAQIASQLNAKEESQV